MTTVRPANKVLVTGATGKTGEALVRELLARGQPVRALVHRRDQRSEQLIGLGAEVVVADMFDAMDLAHALNGCDRAYYCPPWHPLMIQSAAAFAIAAQRTGLGSLVHLSQWLASPDNPSLASRQNWLVEELFGALPGINVVTLNPGFFADNYLRLIDFAAQLGIFPMPTSGSQNAPPSNEDIARLAAAVLLNPARHAGQVYRPTGPDLLSARDMAEIMGSVLGRKVRHIDMPMFMFLKAARALGVSAFEQSGIRHYFAEHKLGAFAYQAPTDHVFKVTGTAPESFETTVRRYAGRPEAQRSLGNTLSALGTFMRIGMTPAHNLDRFDAMQQHPIPARPSLAINDPVWRETRRESLSQP
ncbi:NmrA family NAD(P)-binding protein [Sphingorhabdus sp.]|uniref:NmrA family NAD(P)-binding protein n=1 Tax=Sphingorhabdus sp. TaxID=1902408 RepID=UPI0032B7F4BA